MPGQPDYKVMAAQPGSDNRTFYKQIGVAWKDHTRDGREKVSLQLFMFPGIRFYMFPNEDEAREKKSPQQPPVPPPPDDDIPY